METVPYILKRIRGIADLAAHGPEPFQHFLRWRQSLFLKVLGHGLVIYLHCILEAFHGNKTVNLHNLAFFIRIQVTGIRGQLQQVRVFPVILHDIICHPETVKVQFLIPDPNDGYPLFSCQLGHELPLV